MHLPWLIPQRSLIRWNCRFFQTSQMMSAVLVPQSDTPQKFLNVTMLYFACVLSSATIKLPVVILQASLHPWTVWNTCSVVGIGNPRKSGFVLGPKWGNSCTKINSFSGIWDGSLPATLSLVCLFISDIVAYCHFDFDSGYVQPQAKAKSSSHAWTNTRAFVQVNNPKTLGFQPSDQWRLGKHVIAQSGDQCVLGSWVFARHFEVCSSCTQVICRKIFTIFNRELSLVVFQSFWYPINQPPVRG